MDGTESLDNATINFGTNQNGVSDIFSNDPHGTGAILTLGSNLDIEQVGKKAIISGGGLNGDGVINQGIINAGVSAGTFTHRLRKLHEPGRGQCQQR